jgi:protoheme IX farnesyltransferase
MPALIGWAAVTNEVSLAAWVLFLIIFLWTPPHYWPLSMRYLEEYKSAGVPMLPVVAARMGPTVNVSTTMATVTTSLGGNHLGHCVTTQSGVKGL